MDSKYITVNTDLGPFAIIVPRIVQHCQAIDPRSTKPRSAGFFTVVAGRVQVAPDGSTSLGVDPLPNDAEVIAATLRLSGLL